MTATNMCSNFGSKWYSPQHHHYYYYQVQGQMAICSRKRCDFVVFTNTGISIQQIFFDEIIWTCMASKLKNVFILLLLCLTCRYSRDHRHNWSKK